MWLASLLPVAILIFFARSSESQTEQVSSTAIDLLTVTVRGFLNFRTTVDGTVIVFTPAQDIKPRPTESKLLQTSRDDDFATEPPRDPLFQDSSDKKPPRDELDYVSPPQNSLEVLKTQTSSHNMLDEAMNDLQHISENAVASSPGQFDNGLDKIKINPSYNDPYPTGLITAFDGKYTKEESAATTETNVIGTLVETKYPQFQRSKVISPSSSEQEAPKLVSSSLVSSERNDEIISQRDSQRYSLIDSNQRFPTISSKRETLYEPTKPVLGTQVSIHDSMENSKYFTNNKNEVPKFNSFNTLQYNPQPKSAEKRSSVVNLQSSFLLSSTTSILNNGHETESLEKVLKTKSVETYSAFLPVSTTLINYVEEENGVSKILKHSKLPATSRTRFQSLRRPSQSVRLNRFKVKLTVRPDASEEYNSSLTSEDDDTVEEDTIYKPDEETDVVFDVFAVEPSNVMFQETTITSEVTLHVGRRKSIRTLTITTSVPLTVHPTDIQDILMTESSGLNRNEERAESPNHVVTRTYTTTERTLKTSIVPVFDGKSTIFHSVTESFFIMKIITAYRTLPSGDASAIESALDDPFNAEPTMIAEGNIQPSFTQSAPSEHTQLNTTNLQSSLNASKHKSPILQVSNPFLSLGNALSNNPLAAVYLGLQQLNAQMTLYSTIINTSTLVTTQTIYNTRTIKFYDGRSTRLRTVSEPIFDKKVTLTTTITSLQPYLNTLALQQQQQLQKLIGATQSASSEPQYSTRTSTLTTVTTATSYSTRIYTLIYNGHSTKFRTVTSTSVYPTTATITSTIKIPLNPSQANVPFIYT